MSKPLSNVSRAARKRQEASEELRQAIRLARSSGASAIAIAAAAGLTRQRVHQIIREEA